jgi:hypothetical protein
MASIPSPAGRVNAPRFVATTGAEAFAWADDLDDLLFQVEAVLDPFTNEDAVCWEGGRALCVAHPSGRKTWLVAGRAAS